VPNSPASTTARASQKPCSAEVMRRGCSPVVQFSGELPETADEDQRIRWYQCAPGSSASSLRSHSCHSPATHSPEASASFAQQPTTSHRARSHSQPSRSAPHAAKLRSRPHRERSLHASASLTVIVLIAALDYVRLRSHLVRIESLLMANDSRRQSFCFPSGVHEIPKRAKTGILIPLTISPKIP
jgi:hypothetical protein